MRQGEGRTKVVVTASRTEQDPFDAPRAIDVIGGDDLRSGQYRSLPQALRTLPSTLIQETAPGQGSPFLRGFTGYSNLLLIDGIRVNNSTFRSGPNQYWSTIDPLALDRIEVLRGPASAQYGSDAVGGTVQVFTKSPDRYGKQGFTTGGLLLGRWADAEDSIAGRGELHGGYVRDGGLRTGVLLGGDARAFGDIEGGDATGLQPNTAHDETAFDLKIEHWLGADEKLVFLHQQVAQNDVPRTHATIYGESYAGSAVGTDLQRNLDQNRRLTYLQWHRTALSGPVQAMHFSVSWQTQRELEDRITNTNSQRWQAFEVGTIGTFAQFESDLGTAGRLTYGLDYYHDNVNSWFRRSGTPAASDPIQGQVGNDSRYDLFGVFVQDEIPLGDSVAAQAGVRWTYAAVDSDSVRDPSNAKIAVKDDWDAVTANLHLRWEVVRDWNLYGGVSQGFRAPSLSDLTAFDVARSGEQEVPTPGLDEEEYVGYELGTKVRSDRFSGQLAYFYTDIADQILRFPTGTTNGSGQPIVTKANVGDGFVEGVELQYGVEVVERTTLFGANSWQYGRVSNFNNNGLSRGEEFVSRLMPFTTVVGLRWQDAAGRLRASTEVVRAEDADKTSAGDNRDTQRIPPGGTPGYTIWNLRCGFDLDPRTTLELACENVTDVDYRVHGSGSNGLGTNFVVGMQITF
ncbi:MAG: TonB-dependent receptor [Planctomycetes bacterium]|nr:TonB-dependent receptor [Planctomycetota bacterium]